MKERKYLLKGKSYFLKECTYKDIPSHLERVSLYWNQYNMTLPNEMKDQFIKCIDEHHAYKIIEEDTNEIKAFIYLRRGKVSHYFCTSIYFVRKVYISMIFRYLKRINIRYLYFVPINSDITNIPFRNMLSSKDIREYQATKKYIRIDMSSDTSATFYKYQYERLGVEEILV